MAKTRPLVVPAPARLFGLLAREAHIGVIFRRGPSLQEQLILWDTRNDVFTPGQWFKGRIYWEECDLSPNGELLIYLARKMNRRTMQDREVGPVWKAISKPPYFTALTLWSCYDFYLDRGGWFIDDQTIVAVGGRPSPHPTHSLPPAMKVLYYDWYRKEVREKGKETRYDVEEPSNGWQVIGHRIENWEDSAFLPPREVPYRWSKADKHNHYLLIKTLDAYSRRKSIIERIHYILHDLHTELEYHLGEHVHWADWDQRNRLVFARDGKLFAGSFQQGTFKERELADFNSHQFEPVIAPDWAQKW